MGWQKQLRRLDSELAQGVISYGHYRVRRDAVLASISGTTTPVPRARGSHSGASARARWASTNPSSTRGDPHHVEPDPVAKPAVEHADPTPAVPARRPAELLATERETTAPSPADERPTESIPYPDLAGQPPPDATTPLAAATQPIPQPAQPRPPTQPPPLPMTRAHHGAALGSPGHPARARPAWLWLTLGLVALLALIIGGAWWLAQRPSGSPSATAAASAPPSGSASARSGEVALEDRLPVLPGQPAKHNSTMSVRKGLELGLYPPDTAATFAHNGAREVVYRRSTNGAHGYLVMVIPTRSPRAATATVDYLRATALGSGLAAKPIRGAAGVTGSSDTGQRSGSWYTSGPLAVCTWVSAPGDGEQATLAARLARTVAAVQEALPRR